jgi:hypothetical protein
VGPCGRRHDPRQHLEQEGRGGLSVPSRATAVAAAIVAAMTLAGCGGDGTSPQSAPPAAPSAAGRPEVSTAPAPSPTGDCQAPASSAALSRCLVTALPPGFARRPDKAAEMGPLDLEHAARDDVVGEAAEQFLRRSKFVRGYKRRWQQPGGREVVTVFVYQFAGTAGSAAQRGRWVSQLVPRLSGHFTVPGQPDAVGLQNTAKPAVAYVLGLAGPMTYVVVAQSASAASARNNASTVAAVQRSRLTGTR